MNTFLKNEAYFLKNRILGSFVFTSDKSWYTVSVISYVQNNGIYMHLYLQYSESY